MGYAGPGRLRFCRARAARPGVERQERGLRPDGAERRPDRGALEDGRYGAAGPAGGDDAAAAPAAAGGHLRARGRRTRSWCWISKSVTYGWPAGRWGQTRAVEHDGNGWVRCDLGHRHWGRYGAAGLLIADHRRDDEPWILLQHRAAWTASGNTWGIPGGARDSHESPAEGALREAGEETGIRSASLRVGGELVDDHGQLVLRHGARRPGRVRGPRAAGGVRRAALGAGVAGHRAGPASGFAGTWPVLRERLR